MKLLQVTPENLINFQGTFKEVTSQKIILTNVSDKTVAFKIKTTAPKQYCVRPSIGFIDSNESKDISIMLQPLQNGPSEKAKHKFQVQSIVVEDRDSSKLDSLWKTCSPEDICVAKLVCALNYVPDHEEGVVTEDKVNDTYENNEVNCVNGKESETINEKDIETLPRDDDTLTKDTIQNEDVITASTGVTMESSAAESPAINPEINIAPNQSHIINQLSSENDNLKEEICNLKSTIFGYCHRIEELQAESALKPPIAQPHSKPNESMTNAARAGDNVNADDKKVTQRGQAPHHPSSLQHNNGFSSSTTHTFVENSMSLQESANGPSNNFSILGMPLIVYFLLAFFIGLIIGKFLL